MNNIWIDPVIEIYKKYFGDVAVNIFDIGTRDGDDAQYIADKLNSTNIFAIEANPLAAKETRSRHPNIKVFETAISNYDGETEFVQIVSDDADHAGSSSITKYSHFDEATYNSITVPVFRMDTLLKANSLMTTIFDFVKVDIEGYSYELIESMGTLVDNVKLFHLETEIFNRHEGHKNNNMVIDLMTQNGFLLAGVSYQWENIQDQVWINPSHIETFQGTSL
jgi:FkbM family methyltransferase